MSSVNDRLLQAAKDGNVDDIMESIEQGADVNCTGGYYVCIKLKLISR